LIQGRQIGPFGRDGSMGHLRQTWPQGPVAMARLPRPACPCAFVVARGHPGPRRQAAGGLKAAPVGALLRHEQLGPVLVHSKDSIQHGDGRRKAQGAVAGGAQVRRLPSLAGSTGRVGRRRRWIPGFKVATTRVISALSASSCSSAASAAAGNAHAVGPSAPGLVAAASCASGLSPAPPSSPGALTPRSSRPGSRAPTRL
jgi:hypothetical protein